MEFQDFLMDSPSGGLMIKIGDGTPIGGMPPWITSDLANGGLMFKVNNTGVSGAKYGSFYDTSNQPGGAIVPFTLNTTDFADGVSIVGGSRITFTTLGKFNIAFSAQLVKVGGAKTYIWFWLRHQGIDVPDSATVLEMGNSNDFLVAAWNYFIDVNTNPQFFELMWYCPIANVSIGAIPDGSTPVGVPAVPSIILTVNQVG